MISISFRTVFRNRTSRSFTQAFKLVIALLVSAWLPHASLRADSGQHAFRVKAALQGDLEPGELARLPVDPWVYQTSVHFPNDVRILDDTGKEWPFFLELPKESAELWIDATLRNQTWVTPVNEGDFLEFEVVLPEASGEGKLHDGIEILTTGSRFLRRTELLVSGGPKASFGMGYLVADTEEGVVGSARIDYAISDLQRFRVQVHSSAHQARERFELKSVRVRKPRATVHPVQWQRMEFAMLEPDRTGIATDTQVRGVDLGHSQIPVERIRFDVNDAAFERSVTIWGRNALSEPWRWLHSDAIYRKPGALKLEVKLPSHRPAFRFLRIGELHHDDAPLTLKGIELLARQRWIVFEAGSAAPASLYVGNPSLTRARYDLANRVTSDQIAAAVELRAEVDQADLQSGLQPSFLERYGVWLAALFTALAVLVVLWVILSMVRRMASTHASPGIKDDDREKE